MRRICITFSGAAYDETTAQIYTRYLDHGADQLWVYDDKWLMDTEFYEHNQWLWSYPHTHNGQFGAARGFGWFSWKPLVILDALSRLQDGDIVLYTDADTYPIASLSPLYEECARIGGQMMFRAEGWTQRQWCTRECYRVMGQPSVHMPPDAPHGVARFMLFQKGPWVPQQFLMEWLAYCVNPSATSFKSGHDQFHQEHPEFKEHRTEQAIMTNLAHKYGLKLYREACQWGEGCADDRAMYPQTFVQDGTVAPRTLEGSAFRNMDYSGMLRRKP